jgi:hypothetical protein
MGMGTEVDGLELPRGSGGAEFQFNREGGGIYYTLVVQMSDQPKGDLL